MGHATMSWIEVIETIYDAGGTTKKQIVDTLEDGAALVSLGIHDQEAVEEAHHMVSMADLDEHLSRGGTIGNYQW